MDYLKQAVYLRASELIKSDGEQFLCRAMGRAVDEVLGIKFWLELFPEFEANYDHHFWYLVYSFDVYPTCGLASFAWWGYGLKKPRLLYLEMLLNRYS